LLHVGPSVPRGWRPVAEGPQAGGSVSGADLSHADDRTT